MERVAKVLGISMTGFFFCGTKRLAAALIEQAVVDNTKSFGSKLHDMASDNI